MTSKTKRVPALRQRNKNHTLGNICEKWIADNPKKFDAHLPRRISSKKGSYTYKFMGITPALSLHLREDGQIMVTALPYDILIDFDVVPERTRKGCYVCGLCKPQEAFPTIEGLFIKHSFEPLASWMRSNFKTRNRLVLTRHGGITTAAITSRAPARGVVTIPIIRKAALRSRAHQKRRK